MVLLSLGSDVLVRLMQTPERVFSGPDLSWLLHGPEAAIVAKGGETAKSDVGILPVITKA